MLDWQPTAAAKDRPLPLYTQALLAVLRPGSGWLPGVAILGLIAIPLFVLVPATVGLVCAQFMAHRSSLP